LPSLQLYQNTVKGEDTNFYRYPHGTERQQRWMLTGIYETRNKALCRTLRIKLATVVVYGALYL